MSMLSVHLRPSRTSHALVALMLFTLALSVSLPATPRGLPYVYPWDEAQVAATPIRMAERGDPNPHFFNYPSLALYAYAAADAAALRLGLASSSIPSGSMEWAATVQDEWNVAESRLVLLHRVLTAMVGALTVGLTYVLGARLGLPAAGAFGALLLATSASFAVEVAHTTVDPWATLFSLLALLPLAGNSITRRSALASAALAGMAASCKYPAGLVVLPALIGATGQREERLRRALEVIGVCLGTFVLCSPFLVLDARTAVHDILWEVLHYGVRGHPGAEHGRGLGNLCFHLAHVRQVLGAAGWAAPFGAAALAAKRPAARPMLFFASALLVFMSVQRVAAGRNMDPILPIAALCAGSGAQAIFRRSGLPSPAAMTVVLAVALSLDRNRALGEDRAEWRRPDSRALAAAWLASTTNRPGVVAAEIHVHGEHLRMLPAGTRVATADSARLWLARRRVVWALLPPADDRTGPMPGTAVASHAAGSPEPDSPAVRLEVRLGHGRLDEGPPMDPLIEVWSAPDFARPAGAGGVGPAASDRRALQPGIRWTPITSARRSPNAR